MPPVYHQSYYYPPYSSGSSRCEHVVIDDAPDVRILKLLCFYTVSEVSPLPPVCQSYYYPPYTGGSMSSSSRWGHAVKDVPVHWCMNALAVLETNYS